MFWATRRAMFSGGAMAAVAGSRMPETEGQRVVVDVGRFGARAGAHDNFDARQAAFDSARANKYPVFVLPPETYRVSQPLRIRYPLTLAGSGAYDMNTGPSGCIVAGNGFSAPILTIEPQESNRLRGFSISGLLFDCGHRSNGISLHRCADFALTRVAVRAAQGYGMQFRNSWDAVVVDAFVSECGTPDAGTGAIDILGQAFDDNSNSLHFFGARVESSRGPSLLVHPSLPRSGPNNNIQFVASKFHLPAGDGSTPPTPNLVLHPAEAISFHGAQIFDAGAGHAVIEFAADQGKDTSYAFFGCDIDVRTGDALLGGQLAPGHRFFGCTLRADPAALGPKFLYHGSSEGLQHIRELNTMQRLAA